MNGAKKNKKIVQSSIANPGKKKVPKKTIFSDFTSDEINLINSLFEDYGEKIQFAIKEYHNNECVEAFALSLNYIVHFITDEDGNFEGDFIDHLMNIWKISATENSLKIYIGEEPIIINSQKSVEFARILYRNLCLMHFVNSAEKRPEITASSPNILPQFKPKLSPSQIFQLSYASIAKLINSPYEHSLVQYVHHCFSAGYPIIDLSRLPLNVIETISPTLPSIMAFYNFFGVICVDTPFTDAFKSLSMMLATLNPDRVIEVIHMNNIAASDNGLNEFIENMKKLMPKYLHHIDFSNCTAAPMDQLLKVIASSDHKFTHIGFSNCGITESGCESFFKAMAKNANMSNLHTLKIGNFPFTSKSLIEFNNFLVKIAKKHGINEIDLSGIKKHLSSLLIKLNETKQPLQKLILKKTVLKDDSLTELLNLLQSCHTLNNLDLSNSQIDPDSLSAVINAFGTRCGNNLELTLNGVIENDEIALGLISGLISTDLQRFSSIKLDGCGFSLPLQKVLLPLLYKMPNLKAVSLANFNGDCEFIAESLLSLSIERICLKGSLEDISEIISKISKTKAEFIDLSNNEIDNSLMSVLIKAYQTNNNLRTVKVSNSKMLPELARVAAQKEGCTELCFDGSSGAPYSAFLEMAAAVDRHRASEGLQMQLPEGVDLSAADLVRLSENARAALLPADLHRHCVTRDLGLPLPFASVGSDGAERPSEVGGFDPAVYGLPALATAVDDPESDHRRPPSAAEALPPLVASPIEAVVASAAGGQSEQSEQSGSGDSEYDEQPMYSDSDVLTTNVVPSFNSTYFQKLEEEAAIKDGDEDLDIAPTKSPKKAEPSSHPSAVAEDLQPGALREEKKKPAPDAKKVQSQSQKQKQKMENRPKPVPRRRPAPKPLQRLPARKPRRPVLVSESDSDSLDEILKSGAVASPEPAPSSSESSDFDEFVQTGDTGVVPMPPELLTQERPAARILPLEEVEDVRSLRMSTSEGDDSDEEAEREIPLRSKPAQGAPRFSRLPVKLGSTLNSPRRSQQSPQKKALGPRQPSNESYGQRANPKQSPKANMGAVQKLTPSPNKSKTNTQRPKQNPTPKQTPNQRERAIRLRRPNVPELDGGSPPGEAANARPVPTPEEILERNRLRAGRIAGFGSIEEEASSSEMGAGPLPVRRPQQTEERRVIQRSDIPPRPRRVSQLPESSALGVALRSPIFEEDGDLWYSP